MGITGTYWGSVRCAEKTFVRCLQMTDTMLISVEKRTNMSMGLDFLSIGDMMSAVLGYRSISSRLISIRVRAAPFNITTIRVYAPTSGHDHSDGDQFCQQLQEL